YIEAHSPTKNGGSETGEEALALPETVGLELPETVGLEGDETQPYQKREGSPTKNGSSSPTRIGRQKGKHKGNTEESTPPTVLPSLSASLQETPEPSVAAEGLPPKVLKFLVSLKKATGFEPDED